LSQSVFARPAATLAVFPPGTDSIARKIRDENRLIVTIPGHFSFRDHDVLGVFDWSPRDREVVIDLTQC